MTKRPLDGVRVVEMTVALAGPFGAMMLGQLGAEVVRVESTQMRRFGERGPIVRPSMAPVTQSSYAYPNSIPGKRPWDRNGGYNVSALNKLSMTVDLRKPEGLDTFMRLINISDVVVENNAAGVMERLGLGYAALRKARPDIIMVSLAALGQTGPFKELHGYGSHSEDLFGLTSLRGYEGEGPTTTTGVAPADAAGGAGIVFAVQAALLHRKKTGRGQLIDLPLSENFLPFLGGALMDYSMNKRVQRPRGNHHRFLAPHNCYRCRGEDAWINITVTSEPEWHSLCEVIGRPEMAQDARYADPVTRWHNQRALDAEIEAWTRSQDARELMNTLRKAGVTAGALLTEEECFEDPHLRDRGFFQEMDHREAGRHRYPAGLWKMSGTDLSAKPAPCLGEHNGYVYQELLGFGQDEVRSLKERGHIGTEFAPHVT